MGGRTRRLSLAFLVAGICNVAAFAGDPAGDAWSLKTVLDMAVAQRQEITAAHARAEAAEKRPDIVAALEDPMIAPSIDHYPFDQMGSRDPMTAEDAMGETDTAAPSAAEDTSSRYDWSVALEQKFPLSKIRSHRRRAAEAEAEKLAADVDRTSLDVALEASTAFFMLQEQRRMSVILSEQILLATELASAASARYRSGSGNQAEVLRAELEIARLEATRAALKPAIRSAEAMLNASMGRAPAAPVPALKSPVLDGPLPTPEHAAERATQQRPELAAATAEIERAAAEVDVMRSMYAPMGMVRAGYAETMAEGDGFMVMVGVSLPIWRGKLRRGVEEARAMHVMAVADMDAMRRMIQGSAMAARDALEAEQTRYLALRDDVVPRAKRLMGPAIGLYASGQGSMAGVIEAAQALWSAQQDLVMAESALGVAWARLHRMAGTSLESPL